jgi:hypothetical protein
MCFLNLGPKNGTYVQYYKETTSLNSSISFQLGSCRISTGGSNNVGDLQMEFLEQVGLSGWDSHSFFC